MKAHRQLLLCCLVLPCVAGQGAAPQVTPLDACAHALRAPARVAVDGAANIYVSDPPSGRVAIFDPLCRPLAVRTGFDRPLGLAVDPQGRIYLAEEGKGCVSVFDPQWNLLRKLGVGDGEFLLPSHIAVAPGPSGTIVYVSDSTANLVKAFHEAGSSFVFGGPGSDPGRFDFPAGLCVSPNGDLFVVDQNNNRVQVFDPFGNYLRAFDLGVGGSGGQSGRAQGAFLDPTGRLYVADTFQGLVKVFDAASGAFLSNVGSFGPLRGQLGSPAGLVLDADNRLIVASAATGRAELYGVDSFLHVTVRPAVGMVAAGTTLTFEALIGGGSASCQWRKDGVNVEGATNATYVIPRVDLAATGGYSVRVTGTSGALTSRVAQVQVLAPPLIVADPQDLTVLQGAQVLWEVLATGSALNYQWLLNGLPLEGATNRTLLLPEVQAFQAGAYSVLVENAVGSVLSMPASLSVLVPPVITEIVSTSMAPDGFHLTLNADPGFRYALDTSADLVQWETLADIILDGGMQEFIDPGSSSFGNRFYRFRWVPWPPAGLDLRWSQ